MTPEELDTLLADFESARVDPATFGHRQHLAVAWALLRREDFLDAAARYNRCVQSIAARAGVADKANTTITLAFMALMAERMSSSEAEDDEAFLAEHPDLLCSDLLNGWYSAPRLDSALARRVFLLPDRAPLRAPTDQSR